MKNAIYNPDNLPEDQLPTIYGFNNGGPYGFMEGILIAQDGTVMGSHCCSHEGFMRSDLGILEGSRLDRHDKFREHYRHGYKMEFIPREECKDHAGLNAAIAEHDRLNPAEDDDD